MSEEESLEDFIKRIENTKEFPSTPEEEEYIEGYKNYVVNNRASLNLLIKGILKTDMAKNEGPMDLRERLLKWVEEAEDKRGVDNVELWRREFVFYQLTSPKTYEKILSVVKKEMEDK